MQDARPRFLLLLRPVPHAVPSLALAQPPSHPSQRLVRHGVFIPGRVQSTGVRFEVDFRRVDEVAARVELRADDAGVTLELLDKGFAAPTGSQCTAGGLSGRVRAANAERRRAAVLVEDCRLGLVVVKVERGEGDAAEEREGDGADPGRKRRRLDLDRVQRSDRVGEGVRAGRGEAGVLFGTERRREVYEDIRLVFCGTGLDKKPGRAESRPCCDGCT
ncbi:hypothetical protein OF846_004310 [Rhodotorula toruloides]|nr:hypothetical protein OF846_004310 [Rhodotorula toruloides]